jgi:hypothetical protein
MTIMVAVRALPMAPPAASPCNPLVNPVCWVEDKAKQAASSVGGSAMDSLAKWMQDGVIWLVKNTVTLWIKMPSSDLTQESAVTALQHWLLPISLAVAVGATLYAAARMAISGKANPLLDVGQGLIIVAVTGALCVSLPTMLLKAGDTWSNWVINQSLSGDAGKNFAKAMGNVLALTGTTAPGGVIVPLCLLSLLMSAIQAMLMLFRMAALIILAGVLPLAAAGSLAPGTRSWIKKVTAWMLTLVFYKPVAAIVYATAFTMIGHSKGFQQTLIGLMMLILSIAALPVMMKFFTWATGQAGGGGGGGGLLGAAVSGAAAVGSFRGGGGAGGASASDQARFMGSNGPSKPQSPPKPSGGKDGGDDSGGPNVRPAGAPNNVAPAATKVAGAATKGAAGPVGAAVQGAQTLGRMARDTAESAGPPKKEN